MKKARRVYAYLLFKSLCDHLIVGLVLIDLIVEKLIQTKCQSVAARSTKRFFLCYAKPLCSLNSFEVCYEN